MVAQQPGNRLSLPPLNLLGAIGVPLIVLALVLDQVRAVRQRSAESSGKGKKAEAKRLPPTVPVQARSHS